jgi:hypothetical protein
MGSGKWNEFVKLVRYAYLPYNWFLFFMALIAQFFTPMIAPLFFIFTSNLFDVYGYYFVLRRLWSEDGGNDYAQGYNVVIAYRVIQNLFDYTLLALIWVLFGFKFALAGWILKIFGFQDVLFYRH